MLLLQDELPLMFPCLGVKVLLDPFSEKTRDTGVSCF